jgi:hypothetical protein
MDDPFGSFCDSAAVSDHHTSGPPGVARSVEESPTLHPASLTSIPRVANPGFNEAVNALTIEVIESVES